MDFKTSDGKQLNYQIYGKGYPIIFIHGYGSYQQIWTMQLDFFQKHHFKVITYDQRNHGASQTDIQLKDIDILVRDLKELIMGLHLDHPLLVGHSMGASVIYGLLKEKFSNISAVVAVDQSPKMIGNLKWPYGFMGATRIDYKEKLQNLGKVRETLHGVTSKCRQAVQIARMQFPFDWALNRPLLESEVRKDWRSALIETTIPTLLMTANQSPFFDGHFADELQILNSTYISHTAIDQTGHCIMSEQVDEFNEKVLDFIESVHIK